TGNRGPAVPPSRMMHRCQACRWFRARKAPDRPQSFGNNRSCVSLRIQVPTVSLPVAKIGAFRTVLGRDLTQGSLKSLSLPTIFQAEDEGSIPFTRSNLFNESGGGALGIVSRRAAALCHGESVTTRSDRTQRLDKRP